MYRIILSLLFIGIGAHKGTSQIELTWKDFADVNFMEQYDMTYERVFLEPTFGNFIKSFEGKTISISGYFIQLYGDTMHLVSKPYGKLFLLRKVRTGDYYSGIF